MAPRQPNQQGIFPGIVTNFKDRDSGIIQKKGLSNDTSEGQRHGHKMKGKEERSHCAIEQTSSDLITAHSLLFSLLIIMQGGRDLKGGV